MEQKGTTADCHWKAPQKRYTCRAMSESSAANSTASEERSAVQKSVILNAWDDVRATNISKHESKVQPEDR